MEDRPRNLRARRLEFPIRRIRRHYPQCATVLALGDPETEERNIEPLEPGQVVEVAGLYIRIWKVREREVWIGDFELSQATGKLIESSPEVMTRVEQIGVYLWHYQTLGRAEMKLTWIPRPAVHLFAS